MKKAEEQAVPSKAQDRLDVLAKIEQYEKEGKFDQNVEADIPAKVLMPEQIDYLRRSPLAKLKTYISYRMARKFLIKITKERLLIVKEVKGIENLNSLKTGAVITCNHFNPLDSFAIHSAILQSTHRDGKKYLTKRRLYRVINEANYTTFPGFYGFLMRHFYTLPLSSNFSTMRKFRDAVNHFLKNGDFVLIYAEQAMWWNYKKPRPLKNGAFSFAARNDVPVLPMFITMEDSDKIGPDGFPIQEYTIHIEKPIYPKPECVHGENVTYMMAENERIWREIYEREYKIPLEFSCDKKDEE